MTEQNGNPRVVTTGVPISSPPVAVSLDWLSATFPYTQNAGTGESVEHVLSRFPGLHAVEHVRSAKNGYTDACELTAGILQWHETERRMKIRLLLTGDDLRRYREDVGKPVTLLERVFNSGGRMRRIDVAVDIYEKIDVRSLQLALARQPESCRARNWGRFESGEVGEWGDSYTLYLGSAKSERFIRVYDKAKEQQLDPEIGWTRIEYVARKRFAELLAEHIIENGLADGARAVVRDYVHPKLTWWENALDGPAQEVRPLGRKQTDRYRWLVNDIVPLIEEELRYQTPGSANLAMLLSDVLGEAAWAMHAANKLRKARNRVNSAVKRGAD